jgi:hypothetical protein
MPTAGSSWREPQEGTAPERAHHIGEELRGGLTDQTAPGRSSCAADARLLTLTGAGGSGKSRLAVRSAAELARGFPDGVQLVELAVLGDPALVVHAVFQSLDLRDQTSSWPLDTLSRHLADRRMLLVLDNCEHLLEACAVLVDTLLHAWSDLRFVTVRIKRSELQAALRSGAQEVQIHYGMEATGYRGPGAHCAAAFID